MGIYDRDYYQSERPSFLGSFSDRGRVCKWLIGICIAAFLVQMVTIARPPRLAGIPDLIGGPVTDALTLNAAKVLHGEVWRLVTYAFIHNPEHVLVILFNLLFLWWFGSDVEDLYGSREFLTVYLTSVVASGLAYLVAVRGVGLAEPWQGLDFAHGGLQDVRGFMGAGAAVTMVLVLCALHYPTRIIRLFFILPVPIWLFVIGVVALDVWNFLRQGQPGAGTVAAVDLTSAAFGFVYYRANWRLSSLLPQLGSLGRRLRQPRLRVYREDPAPTPVSVAATQQSEEDQLEARMDAILEKISRTGKESLTQGERDFLLRASEVFKRRRR